MTAVGEIAKAELHLHVDGLIGPRLLKTMENTGDSPGLPLGELEHVCPVVSKEDWLNRYAPLVEPYIRNRSDVLQKSLERHVEELKTQKVIYLEVMLSSFHMQCESIEDQMELYRRFRDTFSATNGIQVEFLYAFGRTTRRERIEAHAERALEAYNRGIIRGVALAGDEKQSFVKPVADIFNAFKDRGMGIEIHAGEWGGPEYVWDALEYGQADRIGHGLALFEDPTLLRYVRDHGIHIEMCPTSNLLLTRLKSVSDHPLGRALQEGLSFSINTDDPGPFGCTLNSEFELMAKTFNLTRGDFELILENSLKAAFAPVRRLNP